MRNYFYKYKIIVPILSISIIYNLLWFSLFIYLILNFSDHRFSITIGFLFFYIALAEPLKDFFIHSVFFKPLYPATEKKSVEDKRIKELSKKSQIGKLMKVLVKDMNITGLTMVVKNPGFKQVNYFKDSSKTVLKIETEDLNQIFGYLIQALDNPLTSALPDEVSVIGQKYSLYTILPIFYKNSLFGFLAFQDYLDARKKTVFESLASRIALLLENDLLTESALKNETFKKEFSVARKIEKILVEHKKLVIDKYSVLFDTFSGPEEESPVLFENSLSFTGKAKSSNYIIYCKISRANKKKRIMMLFIVSGYFLSFSRGTTSLKKLSELLNDTIFRNGGEFGIEGFIAEYKQNTLWNVAYFGEAIHAEADGKKIKFSKTSALGINKKANFKILKLKNKKIIKLSIFQNSEVTIRKNEE